MGELDDLLTLRQRSFKYYSDIRNHYEHNKEFYDECAVGYLGLKLPTGRLGWEDLAHLMEPITDLEPGFQKLLEYRHINPVDAGECRTIICLLALNSGRLQLSDTSGKEGG